MRSPCSRAAIRRRRRNWCRARSRRSGSTPGCGTPSLLQCSTRRAGARPSSTSCTSISTICISRCSAICPAHAHHAARPARPARPVRRVSGLSEFPLVSISDDQRRPCPDWNWLGTVQHGLPPDLYRFSPRARDGYLAFLGRISPRSGRPRDRDRAPRRPPLKIAAKVDRVDQAYFDEVIEPLLRGPLVEYIGEIGDRGEAGVPGRCARAAVPDRLAGAVRAGDDRGDGLRHPGDRLAPRLGAGGDRHGVTGFIVDDVAGAVAAVAAWTGSTPPDPDAFRAAFHRGADGQGLRRAYTPRSRPCAAGSTARRRAPAWMNMHGEDRAHRRLRRA